ncbi:hypothetical protein PBY51_016709 [Eleginops maclovinus]|uniref:Uncharacterized protein n=1 Tax=Eleginops maclovinus TaxID=56733 RepID=A0AAN7WLL1_ELEMC|nr:hypothetical protein PBY51_016709 [Eleginops maclovinus]
MVRVCLKIQNMQLESEAVKMCGGVGLCRGAEHREITLLQHQEISRAAERSPARGLEAKHIRDEERNGDEMR